MKKITAILLILAIAFCFVACSNKKGSVSNQKIKIVTTNFSVYDWTKNLIKDTNTTELSLISGGSVDMHSFNPSAEDILNISSADAFIYIGGTSDKWTTDILKNPINQNLISLPLLEFIEYSEDHNHIKDEHIWLSTKNAKLCIEKILAILTDLDPKNAKVFKANYTVYKKSLDRLDNSFADMVASAKNNTVVFSDRFPFYYLFRDYSINHFAAFDGCEAESEADFETITNLAKKIDELNLSYVLVNDNQNLKIAQTVIKNTKEKNQKILSLNSMQSVKKSENLSYLKIMEDNLKVLSIALN